MDGTSRTRATSVVAHLAASCAIGLVVWLAFGRTAFVNYDTAWSLDWMRQLIAGGSRPDLERLFSPTPHPLSDLFSGLLVPLSDSGGPAVGRGAETAMIVSGLFWIGALGVVTFRLGALWFGTAAGVIAAILVLTREPVLSYGLRTYLDLPYAVFLLLALLAETRRPRNGARTIAWITLAGLLRPEAWLLAAAYVGYLVVWQVRDAGRPDNASDTAGGGDHEDLEAPVDPASAGRSGIRATSLDSQTGARSGIRTKPLDSQTGGRSGNRTTSLDSQTGPRVRSWIGRIEVRPLLPLIALSLIAPVGWIIEGLVLTGDPLQALTGTQQNAADLDRVTGVGSAITVMPRRLGEIVREPVLLAAFGGIVLSLVFLRRRAVLGAGAIVAAAVAFFVLAAAGLPLLTRYLVFPATLLIIFAAAGLLGWRRLDVGHRWRRPWQAFALVALLVFVVFLPGQERRLDRLQSALSLQQRVIGDLRTVTGEVVAPTLTGACRPATSGVNALTLFGGLDDLPAGERRDPAATAERLSPAVALPNHRAVPQVVLWLGRGDGDRPPSVQALESTAAGTGQGTPSGESPSRRDQPTGPAVTLLPSSERVARGFILDKADGDDGLPSAPAGSVRAGTLGTWTVYGRDARCATALRERLPG